MPGSFILIFVLLVFALTMLKICPENRRFAVFRLGRYLGLRGPGLVIVVPSIERVVAISVDDRGELIDPAAANINNAPVSIVTNDNLEVGSMLRIIGFEGPPVPGLGEQVSSTKARVVLDADQRREFTCEKCGHVMRV